MRRRLRLKRAAFGLLTAALGCGAMWLSGHERFDVTFRGGVAEDSEHWGVNFGGPETFIGTLDMAGNSGSLSGLNLDIPLGESEQVLRTYAYLSQSEIDQRVATGTVRVCHQAVLESSTTGRMTDVALRDARWRIAFSNWKITHAQFMDGGERHLQVSFTPVADEQESANDCYLITADSTGYQPQLEVRFAVIEANGWQIGPHRGITVIPLPVGIQARGRLPARPDPLADAFLVSSTLEGDTAEMVASTARQGYITHRGVPGVLSIGAKQIQVNASSRVHYRGAAYVQMSPESKWQWSNRGHAGGLWLNGESVLPRRFARYLDLLGLISMSAIVGAWIYLLRLAFPGWRGSKAKGGQFLPWTTRQ